MRHIRFEGSNTEQAVLNLIICVVHDILSIVNQRNVVSKALDIKLLSHLFCVTCDAHSK
jgi:hypothetical protein